MVPYFIIASSYYIAKIILKGKKMPKKESPNNLGLTTTQSKWKNLTSSLTSDIIKKTAKEIDLNHTFPTNNFKEMGKAGLLGIPIRKDITSQASDLTSIIHVIEELAKACTSTAQSYLMHISALPMLDILATDQQRESLLTPIIEGHHLGSFAMSEPGTGSRWWHMESYCKKTTSGHIINASKSFVTNAGQCQYYIVPVKTSQSASPDDLNIFYIESSTKGINVKGRQNTMGLRGTSSLPVEFNQCRVSKIHQFGNTGEGFHFLMAYVLPIYQIGLSAVYLGVAESAYQEALHHSKTRIYSDTKKTLADSETIQRYITEMRLKIDQTRELVYKVSKMANHVTNILNEIAPLGILNQTLTGLYNDDFLIYVGEVKIASCEMVKFVTDTTMKICGGSAYRTGHTSERLLRDSFAGSLQGPNDDILKTLLGKKLLGLPFPWETQK